MRRLFVPIYQMGIATLSLITFVSINAAELSLFEIAPPQQARIDKVLEIKNEAMKLPGMRSENGILGIRVEALIDEIAEATTEEEMRSAEKMATENIPAKIVLWAADRRERLADYQNFAKNYLNRPTQAEAADYFFSPWKNIEQNPFGPPMTPELSVPRDGTWAPHPVSEEDKVETNRLMMEYSYFMPPTGRMFDHNNSRPNISDAIRSLGETSKLFIVFETDMNFFYECYRDGIEENLQLPLMHQGKPMNMECIRSIFMIPNVRSLQLLAKTYSVPHLSKYVENHIRYYWKTGMEHLDNENEVNENHAVWTALAKQEWKDPEQQKFARLLLSIPPPKHPLKHDSYSFRFIGFYSSTICRVLTRRTTNRNRLRAGGTYRQNPRTQNRGDEVTRHAI